MIAARDVTVARSGRVVLRSASLEVGRGEVVALIAPSGAGKTTLLRTLVRFEEPDSGVVELDGTDVATLAPTELRRRVAFVAQAPVMLPGTVADNLRHGVGPGADVAGCLAAAGLDGVFADRDARALSGGEAARVAVARALTRSPSALLLDEPTAALDTVHADHLGETLRRLRERGLGICVATHDAAFAERWTDRRVTL